MVLLPIVTLIGNARVAAANVWVKINSPANEINISSSNISFSISYNADYNMGYANHPSDEYHWKVSLVCYGPGSGNASITVLSFEQEVTTISGGGSFSVNFPVKGRWQCIAGIDQPGVPYGGGWVSVRTD
jgi:hypothetical protein